MLQGSVALIPIPLPYSWISQQALILIAQRSFVVISLYDTEQTI